jgi:hypothetical protein
VPCIGEDGGPISGGRRAGVPSGPIASEWRREGEEDIRVDGLFRGEVSARRQMTVDDEYDKGERRCDRMSHRHQ